MMVCREKEMSSENIVLLSRSFCGWETSDMQKVKKLCDTDELRKVVQTYRTIMNNFEGCKKESVEEFDEKEYSIFYMLNMRSEEWRKNYFCVLNEYRGSKEIDYEVILDKISIDDNRVEASYASKLLATIDSDCPIIDSCVRFVLGIGDAEGKDFKERKKDAIKKYEWLKSFYTNDKYGDFRKKCLKIFNDVISKDDRISKTKKIDFILWWMGKKKIMVGFDT